MASGTIVRRNLIPIPKITITDSDGSVYDLTNHTIRFIMWFTDTLQVALDTDDTSVHLSGSNVDRIQTNDVLLVDHERMLVTAIPTQPLDTDDTIVTVTRGYDIPATAGYVLGSTDVDGAGTNDPYALSTDCEFDIAIDGGTATTITMTLAATEGNTTMSHLVADMNTALTAAGVTCTASAVFDKFKFTSPTVGTDSSVVISSPDTISTNELGLIAATGNGTATQSTDNVAHTVNSMVRVIKIETDAEIDSLTTGTIKYQWISGDTDKTGEYQMQFDITNPNGKKFTIPVASPSTFTVNIIEDANDYI